MSALGRCRWSIAAGHAPSRGCGAEPEFTSADRLSLLNTGDAQAHVRVRVLYADRDPAGPYRITLAPRRLRRLRINDLIFPEAVRLDVGYGLLVRSDVPVLVQFGRQDTRQAALALCAATAWPEPERTR